MARAHAASACAQSDSIKGLAQTIAKPAYRRLLVAEPALRRAVPTLIVAFLLTIIIGAGVQVLDYRHQEVATAKRELSALAELLTDRLEHFALDRKTDGKTDGKSDSKTDSPTTRAELEKMLPALTPAWGLNPGRRLFIADADGTVLAQMAPKASPATTRLQDILGSTQPPAAANGPAEVIESEIAAGEKAMVVLQRLQSAPWQLVLIQKRDLPMWRTSAALAVTLSTTTGFVVLILGFAFHWQSMRAREADLINDAVHTRIDTALQRGRCGLWDWDLSRGRIFWSRSMYDILGLPYRDDLLTFGDVDALIHGEDIDLFALANQLASGTTDHIDHSFRMRHSDGHWVWLRARCEMTHPIDASGPHLIGIAVDITEQKSLAARSAQADLRLRDAIETISAAFVLWDADSRLVLCNSHFQRLHKLPDHAVLPGTPYETIVEAGQMPIMTAHISGDTSADPGARTFEAQLQDGNWLQISERRTKDGGYVSVGTDITTIKLHEKRLMENEAQLVRSLTDLKKSQMTLEQQTLTLSDLAHRYAEEKRRAEEANETKSKFLANMSHELRTPLNAIIGFSEIMMSEMFGPVGSTKYLDYCSDILCSGQYLLEVINDILDMSKIEAGRMKFDPEDLNFSQLLQESMRVIANRAESKNLVLHNQIADDLKLRGDRRALKQIAINLLSNAVKFTPDEGQIAIHARCSVDSVILMIADTGIGIPAESMKKIGQPFEQVESQLAKKYHGSGLGLAIAKSLTALHGGAMRLRSHPGKGTAVYVRLPRDGRIRCSHKFTAAA